MYCVCVATNANAAMGVGDGGRFFGRRKRVKWKCDVRRSAKGYTLARTQQAGSTAPKTASGHGHAFDHGRSIERERMSDFPARRSKRRGGARRKPSHYQEPLISTRERRSRRVDLNSSISTYRPPLSDLPVVRDATPQYHHHQGFPSIVDQPNQNPAVDLANPILSQGCLCCQCVRSQQVGITEQCGEFQEMLGPGCYCMMWPINNVSSRLSLRLQQMNVTCETKTNDNVFLHVTVSVLYRVCLSRAYEAYYRLADLHLTLKSYVLDVVRSTIPFQSLDQVFASKTEIADAVFTRLFSILLEYGYELSSVLLTKLEPNAMVKASMNEMNAAKRLKQAAPHQAEAFRIEKIKKAEAHSEALYLDGRGMAQGRCAIVTGMQESVNAWTDNVKMLAPTPKEAMDLLLLTQYLDMLLQPF